MNELNVGAIVSAVQKNCHISDAQYAGDLTLCTFLLKMRELYRWEHDIPLTRDMPKSEVGDWMNERERLWETVQAAPFVALPLGDAAIDPFEVEAANRRLAPQGLVYSGGFGRSCKPHFFLANLERQETRQGFQVFVAGCEFARDLDAPPGMMLDRSIFVRTESLKRWLWEKYEEWRWNRRNEAMGRAVAWHGFARDEAAALEAMTRAETESVILHELGEARVGALLGEPWAALLASVMRCRAEIVVRAVRDLYADCLSTLPGLLERDDPAALHFFFANFVGMRRKLFPELASSYRRWVESGNDDTLRVAAAAGLPRWSAQCAEFLDLYARLGDAAAAEIEAWLDRAVPAD